MLWYILIGVAVIAAGAAAIVYDIARSLDRDMDGY